MEFKLPVASGIVVAIISAGVLGLMQGDMMSNDTILTMVAPSMAVFAAIVFAIGVKHGEYRAGTR